MATESFEQAMQRLEQIVYQLEQGQLSLEESVHSFEEGMQLCKDCEAMLNQAKEAIVKVKQEDGKEVDFEEK
ncbi:exodeoxyribonuclease VII small subunit [Catellicoccus marimammalium]|uniref:Exodeoxyribonuclease 7 small subunit n=1 Tax=Catellicoccus marimammalium M35/04/3 TaxID=1234409 RepID=K8Z8J8_9ENTE|nr:exodeoxyribonuclease VII small subunit [Catellicoccus marimammalium]EKU27374.1 hypothetical protein C683_0705 [Catellicoccus marimammalium M35/04/3]